MRRAFPIALLFVTACVFLAHAQTTQPDAIAPELLHANSTTRLELMKQIGFTAPQPSEDSLLEALSVCADDPSPQVRAQAAVVVGCKWIQMAGDQAPEPKAIDIELKLAKDHDVAVRHDVITAALRRVARKDDRVIKGLIECVMSWTDYEGNLHAHVIGGLAGLPADRIDPFLDPYFDNLEADPDRAAWAYLIYLGATKQPPPNVERLAHVGHFALAGVVSPGIERSELDDELRQSVPANAVTKSVIIPDRGGFGVWLLMDGVAHRQRVIEALSGSHVIHLMDDPSRTTLNIASPATLKWIENVAKNAKPAPSAATQGSYAGAFRDLYEYLGKAHPNFQMKQIDWKKVGDELLPEAEQVKTQREFGLLVEQLVARLQDSHAVVIAGTATPPVPDLPQWDPGITCLKDDRDRPVIYAIEKGSPAEREHIAPGMTVVSVNGVDAKDAIERAKQLFSRYFGYSSDRVLEYDAVRAFLKQAEKGTPTKLVVADADGKRISITLPADCGDRYLPRLPVPRAGVEDSADVSFTRLSDDIGYIYVRRIQKGLEDSLDAAVTELKGIKGLIIDVRGNSGGGFDPASAFVNFDSSSATTQPQRPRYAGPIAILIDGRCISAGEGWASRFVANHRARFFGTGTAGASSRKETYELTNHLYKVLVPVKAYTGFLDRPIERRGLEPDVVLRPNARDLAQGKDTVVETAEEWLKSEQK